MKTVFHAANSRGHANHGWLDSYHSFSFAGYYNPDRVHFGALRVLNDDVVAGGAGFGTHPHEDMEIISIPLRGALEHKDTLGTGSVIHTGDVQVMSAGTGIQHSEYNPSKTEEVNFLQVWVFPRQKGVKPRYDQRRFEPTARANAWQTLVEPAGKAGLMIHQDAWFHRADLKADTSLAYPLQASQNGVYFFLLHGRVQIGAHTLDKRDALGVWETQTNRKCPGRQPAAGHPGAHAHQLTCTALAGLVPGQRRQAGGGTV